MRTGGARGIDRVGLVVAATTAVLLLGEDVPFDLDRLAVDPVPFRLELLGILPKGGTTRWWWVGHRPTDQRQSHHHGRWVDSR